MKWFAAHVIMYFQLKEGPQDGFQVYENIFLVRAATPAEAHAKASVLGRREEGDDRGSLRVGERPATRVFGGIRKVISVSHERPGDELGDGDEITYSEFVVDDREKLEQLIRDEDTSVLYVGERACLG